MREIRYIPLERIEANPYQPRRHFDEDALIELAKSISTYGVIQPISVRLKAGAKYELIAGERRLRASKLAGLLVIPSIIVNVSEEDSAVIAIIENLQRQDLHFIEEAQAYVNLLNDYNFTQEELAKKLSKTQSTIANKLRLLKISHEVRKLITEHNLTERHARALLKLPSDEMQIMVVKKIVEFGLTVQKTEDIINRLLSLSNTGSSTSSKDEQKRKVKHIIRDLKLFSNSIKQNISLLTDSGYKADYIVDESEDGCEILIKIEYAKNAVLPQAASE